MNDRLPDERDGDEHPRGTCSQQAVSLAALDDEASTDENAHEKARGAAAQPESGIGPGKRW